MPFLEDNCLILPLSQQLINSEFDCGNDDLNDFFHNDCLNFSEQLLGKSYCFVLESNHNEIVCFFTLANESIKANQLPNARKKRVIKEIPHQKHISSYPAVLIGRLGVSVKYRKLGVGDELLNFIKAWFIHPLNKTGCRFVITDAYNQTPVLSYYKRNGFDFLFSTEEQESEYTRGSSPESSLNTRLMYFDLIKLGRPA